ncbi:MAG: 16S rRNA (cytosine(967)-C(5))-methyltransferase RsmB [Desulfamplus sp.]|nr:16S rRNA (cytosine(967)-C(5))-methyltransferase RsmB [Desulfamplus sp.]
MEQNPRYVALLILIENSRTRRPLDAILDQFATQLDSLSKLDRSLANAIIYGTLRWQRYLDWIIRPFSDRKIENLKTEVIYILRIAMFQIAFMDRIPVSAAVNTAVNSAKKISHQGVAGFVNAVLRKASEGFKDVQFPDAVKEPDLNISVTRSMPLWVVRRWIDRFGFDKTLKLCDTINSVPPVTIRTNTLKAERDALIAGLAPCVDNIIATIYSPVGISFTKLSMPIHENQQFIDGCFQAQDEAAQLVSMMLDPLPGQTILDACAGLGGKTGHVAQLMNNQGVIIACDTDPHKLASLGKEMIHLGVDIVKTVCKDILKVDSNDFSSINKDSSGALFDRVLVDAPCSGMGVLRRNPDGKWKRTKKDLARLGMRQEKMLLSVADLVKPGGTLLYAVCSCETRENDEVVENFLKQRADFTVSKSAIEQHPMLKSALTEKGYFRTYPDHIEMDGFFAVNMQRKN